MAAATGARASCRGRFAFPESITRRSGLPVHPTQLYDALLNLALYLGLAWLYRRRKFDGQVFADLSAVLRRHALALWKRFAATTTMPTCTMDSLPRIC